jgi:hypothetical protein
MDGFIERAPAAPSSPAEVLKKVFGFSSFRKSQEVSAKPSNVCFEAHIAMLRMCIRLQELRCLVLKTAVFFFNDLDHFEIS